jgi:hypothetical protein
MISKHLNLNVSGSRALKNSLHCTYLELFGKNAIFDSVKDWINPYSFWCIGILLALCIKYMGVTKRCRLSWLTKSAFVYEPKCGGEGEGVGVAGSQALSQ